MNQSEVLAPIAKFQIQDLIHRWEDSPIGTVSSWSPIPDSNQAKVALLLQLDDTKEVHWANGVLSVVKAGTRLATAKDMSEHIANGLFALASGVDFPALLCDDGKSLTITRTVDGQRASYYGCYFKPETLMVKTEGGRALVSGIMCFKQVQTS